MSSQMEADIAAMANTISHAAQCLAAQITQYHATWHSVMKPRLFKDGNMWCALHGEDLQVGIAGFGPTPAKALLAFEVAMCNQNGSHVND